MENHDGVEKMVFPWEEGRLVRWSGIVEIEDRDGSVPITRGLFVEEMPNLV